MGIQRSHPWARPHQAILGSVCSADHGAYRIIWAAIMSSVMRTYRRLGAHGRCSRYLAGADGALDAGIAE
jgi:hypothetical protein